MRMKKQTPSDSFSSLSSVTSSEALQSTKLSPLQIQLFRLQIQKNQTKKEPLDLGTKVFKVSEVFSELYAKSKNQLFKEAFRENFRQKKIGIRKKEAFLIIKPYVSAEDLKVAGFYSKTLEPWFLFKKHLDYSSFNNALTEGFRPWRDDQAKSLKISRESIEQGLKVFSKTCAEGRKSLDLAKSLYLEHWVDSQKNEFFMLHQELKDKLPPFQLAKILCTRLVYQKGLDSSHKVLYKVLQSFQMSLSGEALKRLASATNGLQPKLQSFVRSFMLLNKTENGKSLLLSNQISGYKALSSRKFWSVRLFLLKGKYETLLLSFLEKLLVFSSSLFDLIEKKEDPYFFRNLVRQEKLKKARALKQFKLIEQIKKKLKAKMPRGFPIPKKYRKFLLAAKKGQSFMARKMKVNKASQSFRTNNFLPFPKRLSYPLPIIFIQASINNTFLTLTDPKGNTLYATSAGKVGLTNARKSGRLVSQSVALDLGRKCRTLRVRQVDIRMRGMGRAKKTALIALRRIGLRVRYLTSYFEQPYNGCRPPKKRRV